MDSSKFQNQNADPRQETVINYFKNLLQDIFCFVVLFSLAMLVLFAFFYVVDDMTKGQKQELLPKQQPNLTLMGEPPVRRCYWPREWCHIIFHCPKRLPNPKQKPILDLTAEANEPTEAPKPQELADSVTERKPFEAFLDNNNILGI